MADGDDCTNLLTLQIPGCADEPFFPPCEDEGEVCENPDPDRCSLCGQMSEYLKMVVRAPTDKCSPMRYLLDPINCSDLYQTYAQCKIEVLGYVIGVAGTLLALSSLFRICRRMEDVTCCFDKDNSDCTIIWWFLSTYLFLKDCFLDVMGVFTNLAMIMAVKNRNLDCIYLWLLWRTVAITLGAITLPLTSALSFAVKQNVSWIVFMELAGFVGNLVALVVIYAIYEKLAGCLDGGSAEEYEGEGDGYISSRRRNLGDHSSARWPAPARHVPGSISTNN